jgi:poly(ADP-ribose) glycohydrolase ARH3
MSVVAGRWGGLYGPGSRSAYWNLALDEDDGGGTSFMAVAVPDLKNRFEGCLLGLAIGDALGGKFEAQSAESIRGRFATIEQLIDYPRDEIWYTDDTQMAIGVAEALIAHGEILEDPLCRAFAANYVPSRGYGWGARAVLDAMVFGRDHRQVAETHFPGGSFGNGAAMRVAPVGLVFRNEPEKLREQARLSAIPTHRHPLGIEGAQLLALAVAIGSRAGPSEFNRTAFFLELSAACESAEYRAKIEEAASVQTPEQLAGLGNRIEALHSVPTAIASFALTPDSFEATIGHVIFLGGDTDTIAAMAGALSGAHLGAGGLPVRLVNLLENGPKGQAYLVDLSRKLLDLHDRGVLGARWARVS